MIKENLDLDKRIDKIQKDIDNEIMGKKLAHELIYNIDKEAIDQDPYDPRYYLDEGNRVDFIKYMESWIRGSFEYSWVIDMMKMTLDVKSCAFFKGYSIDNKMKLEFHHHPFTMFDYVEAVVNKQLEKNDGWVLEEEVAIEVARLHYRLVVGLVPLDPTSHSQVHDGELQIHPDLVIGEYNKFFEEYNKWIPESTKTKYNSWLIDFGNSPIEYPENYKYKPTIINAYNKMQITTEKIDQLLLEDKLNQVNNEAIAKLLSESGGK